MNQNRGSFTLRHVPVIKDSVIPTDSPENIENIRKASLRVYEPSTILLSIKANEQNLFPFSMTQEQYSELKDIFNCIEETAIETLTQIKTVMFALQKVETTSDYVDVSNKISVFGENEVFKEILENVERGKILVDTSKAILKSPNPNFAESPERLSRIEKNIFQPAAKILAKSLHQVSQNILSTIEEEKMDWLKQYLN